MDRVIKHHSPGGVPVPLLEAKRHKFNVSSRLRALSRRMDAERSTKGTPEEIREDAKRQLSDLSESRLRANYHSDSRCGVCSIYLPFKSLRQIARQRNHVAVI